MIKISNVSFSYKKGSNVFEDFSLNFGAGSVTGLLGKNGTGKSTLLYLITGLIFPQKGEIMFCGTDVRKREPSTLQETFIIPEEFELPDITFKRFVEATAPFYPNFSYEQLRNILEVFEMPIDVKFNELSMGQRKKAYTSFALATNTRLLVMDEPSNGLDIPSKSQFRKAIALGMNDDKSIIISTHQVRDIDSLLDHVVIIDNKKVLLDASTTEIGKRLFFDEDAQETSYPDIIFSQPSITGNSILRANTDNEESRLNLELLFNATLARQKEIAEIFKSK
ncbi:MAG: ABC transporter ATP-binding protein [Bacteroidaceae bacterium]|nr:ABC transporter ATP-binding protein [Bacteroidaceae bacterium]